MSEFRRLLGACLLAVLAVSGATASFAQEKQETESGQTIEPDHLAAARTFIEATGSDDLTEQVLVVFKPRVEEIVRTQHPDITDAKFRRFMELFTARFREQKHMFEEAADRIFAGFISKEDLDEGIAFYRSSAGQSFVEARPKILEALGDAGRTGMTIEDVVSRLPPDDGKAYRDFVTSDLGKRLSVAQEKIHHVWVRFGARIGLKVSGRAGTDAIRQMEEEGDGL